MPGALPDVIKEAISRVFAMHEAARAAELKEKEEKEKEEKEKGGGRRRRRGRGRGG